MSGDLSRRLNKLQVILGAMGCATCERWHRTEVRIIAPPTDLTDSTERAEPIYPSRPDKCPDCRVAATLPPNPSRDLSPCTDAEPSGALVKEST